MTDQNKLVANIWKLYAIQSCRWFLLLMPILPLAMPILVLLMAIPPFLMPILLLLEPILLRLMSTLPLLLPTLLLLYHFWCF